MQGATQSRRRRVTGGAWIEDARALASLTRFRHLWREMHDVVIPPEVGNKLVQVRRLTVINKIDCGASPLFIVSRGEAPGLGLGRPWGAARGWTRLAR